MKILKRIVVILIMLSSMLTIRVFASTGKINVSATRLRKENNTTSKILAKIYEDEEVEIIEESGEWLKVKYNNHTGYIKKEFVDIKEDNNKEETNKNETVANNNKNNNNNKENVSNYENIVTESKNTNETTILQDTSLKLIPNFMSKNVQDISAGTKITKITQMNKWIKVTDGLVEGWILESKLKNDFQNTSQVNPSDIDSTNNTNTLDDSKNEVKTDKVKNETNKNTVKNEIKTNTITNQIKNNNTVENKVTNNVVDSTTKVSKKGKVNVETANVRKEPSTSSKRIEFLDEGDIVTITEENDKWYKIKHGDIEGYVSKDLITITSENDLVSSRGLEEERQKESISSNSVENVEKENSSKEQISKNGNSVVEYAKQYLNYPYVVAGKTPETGFDCSGFTRYVYKNFGYELSSVSSGQTSIGEEISRENLEPGDLILFYNEGKTKIGHTGIYIGNGEFIHAANAKRGVVIDNINTLSYYNERFVTARRIVK